MTFKAYDLSNGTFAAAHSDPGYQIGCYREDLLDFVFQTLNADLAGFTVNNQRYSNRHTDAWISKSAYYTEPIDYIVSNHIVGDLTRVLFYNHVHAEQTAEFLNKQLVAAIIAGKEHRWRW